MAVFARFHVPHQRRETHSDIASGDATYGDVIYGDATSGDVIYGDATSGDVTIPIDPPQIRFELSLYTTFTVYRKWVFISYYGFQ
jgi:hypothetical protein